MSVDLVMTWNGLVIFTACTRPSLTYWWFMVGVVFTSKGGHPGTLYRSCGEIANHPQWMSIDLVIGGWWFYTLGGSQEQDLCPSTVRKWHFDDHSSLSSTGFNHNNLRICNCTVLWSTLTLLKWRRGVEFCFMECCLEKAYMCSSCENLKRRRY